MSYGLYDSDICHLGPMIFNLELMKYSSYFKKERQIVSLSPIFNPEKYTNFIYRRDFDYENDTITPLLNSYQNVTYGGKAFNKLKYIPLPLEIEASPPDVSLYEKTGVLFHTKRNKRRFRTYMGGEHLRLSLDGKTIWKDFEKQLTYNTTHSTFLFHDYNLNEIDGVIDIVKNLQDFSLKKYPPIIGVKFPLQFYSIEDLLKWPRRKMLSGLNSIQYNGLVKAEEETIFYEIINHSKDESRLIYNPLYGQNEKEFVKKNICYLFQQVVQMRSLKKKILLIYDKDFFSDERWYNVMEIIRFYYTNAGIGTKKVEQTKNETLFSYIKRGGLKAFKKEETRKIFLFIKKNNIDLFKAFYEYHI